jgi:hypothetical protein
MNSVSTKLYIQQASGQYYKTFLGVINATGGVFPYDFDWGYANSNEIMLKKVL